MSTMMPQEPDHKMDPARLTREQEFMDAYDPELDEPTEPVIRPPRCTVHYSPRFIQQMRALGAPRFPLVPVPDAA